MYDVWYIIVQYDNNFKCRTLNKCINVIYEKEYSNVISVAKNVIVSQNNFKTKEEEIFKQYKLERDVLCLQSRAAHTKLILMKKYTNKNTRQKIIDCINSLEFVKFELLDECELCYCKSNKISFNVNNSLVEIFNRTSQDDPEITTTITTEYYEITYDHGWGDDNIKKIKYDNTAHCNDINLIIFIITILICNMYCIRNLSDTNEFIDKVPCEFSYIVDVFNITYIDIYDKIIKIYNEMNIPSDPITQSLNGSIEYNYDEYRKPFDIPELYSNYKEYLDYIQMPKNRYLEVREDDGKSHGYYIGTPQTVIIEAFVKSSRISRQDYNYSVIDNTQDDVKLYNFTIRSVDDGRFPAPNCTKKYKLTITENS
jgi:hypothetical protein